MTRKTPQLGLGCWGLGGDAYGLINDELSRKIIHKAIDNGIRFFDTSPTYGYGLSEKRLGKFLPKIDDIIIATKVGMIAHSGIQVPLNFSPKYIEKSIDESLFRLKLESIYLAQLHSPMLDYKEIFPDIIETLDKINKKGKVKNWGISIAKPEHLPQLIGDWNWSSVEFNFSLIDQRIIKFKNICANFKGTMIGRTPLNFGFLSQNSKSIVLARNQKSHLSKWSKSQINKWSWAASEMKKLAEKNGRNLTEMAIRFCLDTSLVDYCIPGAMSADELEENISAVRAQPLSNKEIDEIYLAYSEIENQLQVVSPFKDIILD